MPPFVNTYKGGDDMTTFETLYIVLMIFSVIMSSLTLFISVLNYLDKRDNDNNDKHKK
jgi:Na+/melibiose symporter-like transporter